MLGLKSVFSVTKVPLAPFVGLKCSKHTVGNRFLRPGLYSPTNISMERKTDGTSQRGPADHLLKTVGGILGPGGNIQTIAELKSFLSFFLFTSITFKIVTTTAKCT